MHINRLFLLHLLPRREAYRLAFKARQRLFNRMLNEINAHSLGACLSEENRIRSGGSFLLHVKDIYVGDTRHYYSNLLQVAALTNGGASQAAGLVSGVSFM